jgi:hypothetical protein
MFRPVSELELIVTLLQALVLDVLIDDDEDVVELVEAYELLLANEVFVVGGVVVG